MDKYMNAVIESYENYREEERLTTDRGRRVEFLTTMRILREWIEQKNFAFWMLLPEQVFMHFRYLKKDMRSPLLILLPGMCK